jgi:hypothetical protein
VYAAYWATAIVCIAASWLTFRHVLHPHFLLTISIVVMFLLEYLVQGGTSGTVPDIDPGPLQAYQVTLLLTCLGASMVPLALRRLLPAVAFVRNLRGGMAASPSIQRLFAVAAWTILALKFLKRFRTTGWSLADAVLASFGPRGSAPWNYRAGNLGDENFVYSIIGILMPLSGMLFAYLVSVTRSWARLIHSLALAIIIAMIVSDGARTPLMMVLGTVILFHFLSRRGRVQKIVVAGAMIVTAATLTSIMYLHRTEGYRDALATRQLEYQVVYHQDDNHRGTISALHLASTTPERWAPGKFFLTILVNPVPRAYWPEKPALLQDFWGTYKNEWTTIGCVGELAALAGPIGGPIAAVGVALLLFLLMILSARLIRDPAGLILYLVVALYAYMVMRSLCNLTQFLYLPAATFVVYRWVRHLSAGTRTQALPLPNTQVDTGASVNATRAHLPGGWGPT